MLHPCFLRSSLNWSHSSVTSKMITYPFLTGTDHPIPHLYDINTFKCFLPANIPEIGVNGAINQACSALFLSLSL